ncbi:hypothetical protein LTR91_023654, partial [Friedmanniomyces endolithicus]
IKELEIEQHAFARDAQLSRCLCDSVTTLRPVDLRTPPAASTSHTPACAKALGTSNSGTGTPFARGSFAEQRTAA